MRIYIPTKGRVNNQATYKNLPDLLKTDVIIVCPIEEVEQLQGNCPLSTVVSQPDSSMGISAKRKWIIDTTEYDRIVMLDDDLRFAVRRLDDPGKFFSAQPRDIVIAFAELEAMLDEETPHAGFAARGGAIGPLAEKGGWQEAKRLIYTLGYYVPIVRQHAIFGRLSTHEDIDVTLQLLTKGFPNLVNFGFLTDQKFGNPGGCTEEREIVNSNADCLRLKELFPEFVRLTFKEYAGSPERIEVVCSWIKALDYGLQNRK